MKAPINPSEPLFPVRPNEPVCNYYMKHGTCKFGQACKFHHPPQPTLHSLINGDTQVVMNVSNVGRETNAATQLLLSPVGADPTGSQLMLQFLPQRPEEPDCIYFLKNGRCKYGATCRYHHPINYNQRRGDETRRRRVPNQDRSSRSQNSQYVAHSIASTGHSKGHVVVSDNSIALMGMEGRPNTIQQQQSYPAILSIPTNDSVAPVGSMTDQCSSTCSIASSHETTTSSLEQFTVHGDLPNALLHPLSRSKRNGSGSNLSTFTESSVHGRAQTRAALPHSASDGNISRRNRVASLGSAGEVPQHYELNSSPMLRDSNGTIGSRRNERQQLSIPFESSLHVPAPTQYSGQSDTTPPRKTSFSNELRNSASRVQRIRASRPPAGQARHGQNQNVRGESEEGFSMMTSALLNMLDSPDAEKASACDGEGSHYRPMPAQHHRFPSEEIDPAVFDRLSLIHERNGDTNQKEDYHHPRQQDTEATNWPPAYQASISATNQSVVDHATAFTLQHPSHAQPSGDNTTNSSDIKLCSSLEGSPLFREVSASSLPPSA